MIKVKDIIKALEDHAPLSLQESWDNCGLLVGDRNMVVDSALCTLDVTLEVIEEAKAKGCNMIVTHHPLIFGGLKSITGRNEVEKCVIEAIKNNIAIYVAHTNMDSVEQGVSGKMAEELGLRNCEIMAPQGSKLLKLVVFVPKLHVTTVRDAMFEAGAGHVGKYDSCSYSAAGQGTFRGLDDSNPFVGNKGELHVEDEVRLEVILPQTVKGQVVSALLKTHPYEEVAYDLYQLENVNKQVGFGVVGELEQEVDETTFLAQVKDIFKVGAVRHSPLTGKTIKKVAVMGGSGASFMRSAMSAGADVFITGDVKYHDFFIPEGRILLADIGHYESEQYTKELFKEIITKKMTTFAAQISVTETNHVKYC